MSLVVTSDLLLVVTFELLRYARLMPYALCTFRPLIMTLHSQLISAQDVYVEGNAGRGFTPS